VRWLRGADRLLAGIEKAVSIALLAALLGIGGGTILLRVLGRDPSPFWFEITPALVLWLSLFGASLALQSGRHIRLEGLFRAGGEGFRRFSGTAAGLLGLLLMGILFVVSLAFIRMERATFGARGWLALVFPWFFGVSAFRFLLHAAGLGSRPGPE